MRVYARSGEFLGRVIAVGETHFEIEKGYFVHHDWNVENEDVAEVTEGRIVLRRSKAELEELHPQSGTAVPPPSGDLSAEHTQ